MPFDVGTRGRMSCPDSSLCLVDCCSIRLRGALCLLLSSVKIYGKQLSFKFECLAHLHERVRCQYHPTLRFLKTVSFILFWETDVGCEYSLIL